MILNAIKIKNFKAIRNSGTVKLGKLNVLIGNNGSGKSSLMEAAETYRTFVGLGLDSAMQRFMGMEHVQNKYAKPDTPITFDLNVKVPKGHADLKLSVATDSSRNLYNVLAESLTCKALGIGAKRDASTKSDWKTQPNRHSLLQSLNLGVATGVFDAFVNSWQFFSLVPEQMGLPRAQTRTGGRIFLSRDGANIAEYLLDIRERSPSALDDIIQAMSYVLPYASDIQPVITIELERKAWLQMSEGNFKIPGWMLSTGTLRVLSLIAVLMDPDPPPIVFIEEIENGLDPRTVGLLVDLMRSAAQSGRMQIVTTTHSPYLLDLLDLDDVLLCERGPTGPEFSRPAGRPEMAQWRDRFMPGKLYTMNALQHEPQAPIADDSRVEGEAPDGGWGADE